MLKDNVRMLRFVEHLGFRQVRTIDGDIVEIEIEIDLHTTQPPTTPEPIEAA